MTKHEQVEKLFDVVQDILKARVSTKDEKLGAIQNLLNHEYDENHVRFVLGDIYDGWAPSRFHWSPTKFEQVY